MEPHSAVRFNCSGGASGGYGGAEPVLLQTSLPPHTHPPPPLPLHGPLRVRGSVQSAEMSLTSPQRDGAATTAELPASGTRQAHHHTQLLDGRLGDASRYEFGARTIDDRHVALLPSLPDAAAAAGSRRRQRLEPPLPWEEEEATAGGEDWE